MTALITMMGTIMIPAIVACVASVLAYLKSKEAFAQSAVNTNKAEIIHQTVHELEVKVNSRLSELIEAIRLSAYSTGHAEGMVQGAQNEANRGREIATNVLTARTLADVPKPHETSNAQPNQRPGPTD